MAIDRVEHLPTLPPRESDGHKGLYGFIVVIGGSRGMAGAPALCGASALRSGAGLVRILSPEEVQPTVASFEPCCMTYPLPQTSEGGIDFNRARPLIERFVAEADIVAVGPGLGQSDEIQALVKWLVQETDKPLVIDADALNVLAKEIEILSDLSRPVVITPHPGEFGRLAGLSTAKVQANRVALAARLAGRFNHLIVVLKGEDTVVTDGRRAYVNTTGNPGMASGGSGDVLTGVIAAMLGQGLAAFEAAQLGTYMHGLAGDYARDQSGEVGMIAGDIVDFLPDAFLHPSGEIDHDHDDDDHEIENENESENG